MLPQESTCQNPWEARKRKEDQICGKGDWSGAWEFHTACVLMFWRNEPRMWSFFQASSREACREKKHYNKRGHLFPADQIKLLIGEIAGLMHMWLPVSPGQPIMHHRRDRYLPYQRRRTIAAIIEGTVNRSDLYDYTYEIVKFQDIPLIQWFVPV